MLNIISHPNHNEIPLKPTKVAVITKVVNGEIWTHYRSFVEMYNGTTLENILAVPNG